MGRLLYAGLAAMFVAACGASAGSPQQQTGPTSAPVATPPAAGTAAPPAGATATPTPTPYDY